MKIKKKYQGTVPQNKILDTHSTSNTDTYSCNYVNELEAYSESEKVVGSWYGKPLYRKSFTSFLVNNIPTAWTDFINLSGYNIGTIVTTKLTAMGSRQTPVEIHLYLMEMTSGGMLRIYGPAYYGNLHVLTLEYTKTTD